MTATSTWVRNVQSHALPPSLTRARLHQQAAEDARVHEAQPERQGGVRPSSSCLVADVLFQIPTLVDHQRGDFAIWESNAILQYLVSEYDKEHKISVADDDKEGKYRTEQWLFFQASGQGPYFGYDYLPLSDRIRDAHLCFRQAQWFMYFHPEHLPSAIKRYQDEIRRVFGVLDNVLSERDWCDVSRSF